jgi:hypothetical protein
MQSITSASGLGGTPVEALSNTLHEIQNTENTPRKIKLLHKLQAFEARNDYLEQELGSERWDKEELKEELERVQGEYAKLNGGKRYRKPRPAYLEKALEASIDKTNAWVRNSRSGEATSDEEERRLGSVPPAGPNRDIFSDLEDEDEERQDAKRRKILRKKAELCKSLNEGNSQCSRGVTRSMLTSSYRKALVDLQRVRRVDLGVNTEHRVLGMILAILGSALMGNGVFTILNSSGFWM